MAGFPLAAIGAGIGQFFQNYEQQKRSQQQRALEQLQADALRQNQLRQQKQDQASGLLFNSLLGGESGQASQAQPFTMPSLGSGQGGGGGGYGDLSGLANLGGGAEAMGPPATSGGQRNVPGTIMHDAGGDYRIPQTYGSKFADEILLGPQRTQSGGDLGGGLRAGGALTGNPFVDKLVSLGVKPEVASGAVEYMRRNESGLRPDAVNPSSGALGAAQWLGPRKRALQGQYGAAPGLSQQADFMGQELQGPEGRTLAALRGASSGRQGYDIWGRDYERPGGAALAKAGVGGASPIHQEAQQAALGAAQITPPEVYGRMSLRGLAQQIDKANPDADPVVKMMALEQAAKLLAPSDQRAWEMFKLQHDDQFKIAQIEREDRRFDIADAREAEHEREFRSSQDRLERAEADRGWQIIQKDGKTYRVRPATGETQEISGMEGATKIGTVNRQPLDQADAKFWAGVLRNGGTLPPGAGRSGAVVQQIMKEFGAGDMSPGDFIARHASVQADTSSLRNMQKMADSAISFENLAEKNFDVALKLAPDAVPTDLGPFFNRWIEQGETMLGDPNVPPYVAAIITGANEYAKVMSGSTGTVASTVDSRREARDLFSPYLSLPQISNVVAVAKADMKNRRSTLNEQVGVIQNRLGSSKPTETAPPAQPNLPADRSAPGLPTVRSQAEYDALAPGARYLGPDGQERQKPGRQEPPT